MASLPCQNVCCVAWPEERQQFFWGRMLCRFVFLSFFHSVSITVLTSTPRSELQTSPFFHVMLDLLNFCWISFVLFCWGFFTSVSPFTVQSKFQASPQQMPYYFHVQLQNFFFFSFFSQFFTNLEQKHRTGNFPEDFRKSVAYCGWE